MNQHNFEVVQQAAAIRGMTVAGFVEFALGSIGIPLVEHAQQSTALVESRHGTKRTDSFQGRRSVSINRLNYEATRKIAADRGMSIVGLVEAALVALSVPVGSSIKPAPVLGSANGVAHPQGQH